MYRFGLIFGMVLVSFSAASAQMPISNPKLFDRIVWGDWGERYYLPFDPQMPAVCDRYSGRVRTRILPPVGGEGNGWSLRDNFLYFLQSKEADNGEIEILHRLNLDLPGLAWEQVAQVDSSKGIPLFLTPLDKSDHYLAFNWVDGFVDGEHTSFTAVFSQAQGDKRLMFESLVNMPFEEKSTICKLLIPSGNDPGIGTEDVAGDQGVKDPGSQLPTCMAINEAIHPTLWSPVITHDYIFLAATRPGVVWVFSAKDGSCVKSINLGGVRLGEMENLTLLNHFLLGMQPTIDGDVIVATRSLYMLNAARTVKIGSGVSAQALAKATSDFEALIKDDGNIVWWRIDSKTLNASKPENPYVQQIKNLDFAQAGGLKFLVAEDGKIVTNYSTEWAKFLTDLTEERIDSKKLESPWVALPGEKTHRESPESVH